MSDRLPKFIEQYVGRPRAKRVDHLLGAQPHPVRPAIPPSVEHVRTQPQAVSTQPALAPAARPAGIDPGQERCQSPHPSPAGLAKLDRRSDPACRPPAGVPLSVAHHPMRLIGANEARALLGASRSLFNEWVSKGFVPPPIRIGRAADPRQRHRRWRLGDILCLIPRADDQAGEQ
ncbi:MAG: hypothetical protein R3E83_18470 [Burkholderiaceae bacterium]